MKCALVSGTACGIPWPTNFNPVVNGWDIVSLEEDGTKPEIAKPHLLGIRLDYFVLSQKDDIHDDTAVGVTVLNAGVHDKQAVVGGCFVRYIPKNRGNSWVVELAGLDDP